MGLVAAALGGVLAAPAGQAAILGQSNNGDVYVISTSGSNAGTAALYRDLADKGTVEPNNTPNALGFNGAIGTQGSAFRTGFTDDSLYRNNDFLINLGATGTVAAGDVLDNTYYYVDRNFEFRKVTNISGAPGSQSDSLVRSLGGGETIGDIAIDPTGTYVYLSSGNSNLRRFQLDGSGSIVTFSGADRRYAGLAFDFGNGELYGVVGGNPTGTGGPTPSTLWWLDFIELTSANDVSATFVANILLNGQNTFLTDAAGAEGLPPNSVVPLPAAVWLLGAGFLGYLGIGYSRRNAQAA
jgi:hypothetical protein